jgi:hypothetical protein
LQIAYKAKYDVHKGGLRRKIMRRGLFVALTMFVSLLLPGGALAMSTLTGGSVTGASLNSNTASSAFGGVNEANFLRIKNSNSPNSGFTSGTIDVNSDAVLIQAFVSNSSTSELARNVNLNITLPTGFATRQTVAATLTSDNAGTLSDTAAMADSQPFGLEFDPGSQVFVAKRSGTGNNNFINQATGNIRINGNVMTVALGDWMGGSNQQGLITVRMLVTRPVVAQQTAVQPVAFVCSGLDRSFIDNNHSTFTARTNGQAAGVNISSFNFTVRDSSGRVVDTNTVNTNSQTAVFNFSQSNPGTFTVSAIANSDKGATGVTSACTQTVTVPAVLSSATTATAAAPASNALPNTGAGDVIGIFTGTSALGAGAHYAIRRFRRF